MTSRLADLVAMKLMTWLPRCALRLAARTLFGPAEAMNYTPTPRPVPPAW